MSKGRARPLVAVSDQGQTVGSSLTQSRVLNLERITQKVFTYAGIDQTNRDQCYYDFKLFFSPKNWPFWHKFHSFTQNHVHNIIFQENRFSLILASKKWRAIRVPSDKTKYNSVIQDGKFVYRIGPESVFVSSTHVTPCAWKKPVMFVKQDAVVFPQTRLVLKHKKYWAHVLRTTLVCKTR
jgi:hypothetical protein